MLAVTAALVAIGVALRAVAPAWLVWLLEQDELLGAATLTLMAAAIWTRAWWQRRRDRRSGVDHEALRVVTSRHRGPPPTVPAAPYDIASATARRAPVSSFLWLKHSWLGPIFGPIVGVVGVLVVGLICFLLISLVV